MITLTAEQAQQIEEIVEHLLIDHPTARHHKACVEALSIIRAARAQEQEPVARVTGYHGGRCVVEPLNRALVLPIDMALYAEPVQQVARADLKTAFKEGFERAADLYAPNDGQEPYAYEVWDVQDQSFTMIYATQLKEFHWIEPENIARVLYTAPVQQAEQEPVVRHICNLWVDPVTKEYVVDHCDHPIDELIPAYNTPQIDITDTKHFVNQLDKLTDEDVKNIHMTLTHELWARNAAPVEPVKQKPVAWARTSESGEVLDCISNQYKVTQPCTVDYDEPLYAAPVRTKDLTDDEIHDVFKSLGFSLADPRPEDFSVARAVIAADREKNK